MAAKAILRSGAGLLEVHAPNRANTILQTAIPEAMVHLDKDDEHISQSLDVSKYDSIAFGPGLGTEKGTCIALREYLEKCNAPVVLDADALNIISENPSLMELVPAMSILTPHPGEFRRLVGAYENDYHRLELTKKLFQGSSSHCYFKERL